MPDHPSRPEVMAALTEHLGPHVAAAVLEALPPYDWHSLATKDDLRALEHQMTARFAAVDARFEAVDRRFAAVDLRFEAMEARFTALDTRLDALETKIDDRCHALDTKIDSRIDGLEGRLTAAFHAEMNRQLRWMIGSIVAIVAAAGGIATAVAALT